LKVLWLGQQDTILPWLNDLRHELSKLCEIVAYGDGSEFVPNFDVLKIVAMESPDVIMIANNQYKFFNLNKVNIPKALKCTDHWANIRQHIDFIKNADIQLVLMNYNCATPEYEKCLPDRKFGRLPHTLNTSLFKNLGLERDVDVMCIESASGTYPVKTAVYLELQKSQPFKVFISRPHTLSFDDYVKKINQSKIFAFGNVNMSVGESEVMVFPMAKIYEIMGCETLCMMDTPDESEELHFIPDYNFISINTTNFLSKIQYWLDNETERIKIARRGFETCLQYHTVEIRARELKEILEGLIKK